MHGIYLGELRCPYCQHAQLEGVYLTPCRLKHSAVEDGLPVDYTEHMGECCSVKCPNCEFEFIYSTEQPA